MVTPSRKSLSRKSHVRQFLRNWEGGGYLVAVMGSTWLILGLKICRIFWPNTITNQDLLTRCQQQSMDNCIARQRWNWIGHVMRREPNSIPKVVLHWTPDGTRKRGRPKTTWRRTAEEEMKTLNLIWAPFHKEFWLIASFLNTRFAIELRLISIVRLIATLCEMGPWGSVQKTAQNRQEWRNFVAALHSRRHNGQ